MTQHISSARFVESLGGLCMPSISFFSIVLLFYEASAFLFCAGSTAWMGANDDSLDLVI
jgi:hypothetical protein